MYDIDSECSLGVDFTSAIKTNPASSESQIVSPAAAFSSSPGTFSSFCSPASPPGSRRRKKPTLRLEGSFPRRLPCSPTASSGRHFRSSAELPPPSPGSEYSPAVAIQRDILVLSVINYSLTTEALSLNVFNKYHIAHDIRI